LEPKIIKRGEAGYTTTLRADYDKEFAVVTQSGKTAVGNAKDNDGVKSHEEEQDSDEEENSIQVSERDKLKENEENHKQSPIKELQKNKEKSTSTPKSVQPLPKIVHPFPQRLKKKNKDEKFKKF